MCNEEDIKLIESVVAGVKNEKTVVVRVEDVFISYYHFKCLLNPSAFLNGDVSIQYTSRVTHVSAHTYVVCIINN